MPLAVVSPNTKPVSMLEFIEGKSNALSLSLLENVYHVPSRLCVSHY